MDMEHTSTDHMPKCRQSSERNDTFSPEKETEKETMGCIREAGHAKIRGSLMAQLINSHKVLRAVSRRPKALVKLDLTHSTCWRQVSKWRSFFFFKVLLKTSVLCYECFRILSQKEYPPIATGTFRSLQENITQYTRTLTLRMHTYFPTKPPVCFGCPRTSVLGVQESYDCRMQTAKPQCQGTSLGTVLICWCRWGHFQHGVLFLLTSAGH